MKAVIFGPTGVVGDAIIREGLQDARLSTLVAIGRRPLKHRHPRLTFLQHTDFTNFSPLEATFADAGVVLWALGLSWYQARDEAQYRQITHDFVMACARVASIANPAIRFCFVSGSGAALNGSQAWARIKAESERDLASTFGSRLNVFRPGYIHPRVGRETRYWGDLVMMPFMPFRGALSRWITDSDEVARAILYAATGGAVPSPASNLDIIAASAAYTPLPALRVERS